MGKQQVALERNLFGYETTATPPTPGLGLRARIFVDRYATDSYQNILCSLIQFPLFVRRLVPARTRDKSLSMPLPSKLTVISHDFKRARFLDLHLPALRWGRETKYIGIDPPFDAVKMAEIQTGDRLRGYGAWKGDLYGTGEVLGRKRRGRGWDAEEFRRQVLEMLPSAREREMVSGLVGWHGGSLYTGDLPWD